MSDTIAADVLDQLYVLLTAETTLAAAMAAGTLKIFDGPPTVDFHAESMLTIGAWPVVGETEPEVAINTDWSAMASSGALADVDQMIDVPLGIYTLLGNSDKMAVCRRTAITYYAKAASAIRGSTLSLGQVMWCIPDIGSVKQTQTENGAECLITFTAHVRTRI